MRADLLRGPRSNDFAAKHASARPEVEQPVRLHHRLRVVLDDEHRVPEVSELDQGVEQRLVVTGVEADRGLIENVEHTDEPTPDLAGEPDALPLAAGEGRRRTVEREVVQADIEHELKPVADLLEHLPGDLELLATQSVPRLPVLRAALLEGQNPGMCLVDRHRAHFGDRPATDGNGTRLGTHPCSFATGAGLLAHKARVPAPGLL